VADTRALEAARRLLATVEDARGALLEVAASNLPPMRARRLAASARTGTPVTPVLVRIRRMQDAAAGRTPTVETHDDAPRFSPQALAEAARARAVRMRIASLEEEARAVTAPASATLRRDDTPPDGTFSEPLVRAALAVRLLGLGLPRDRVLDLVALPDDAVPHDVPAVEPPPAAPIVPPASVTPWPLVPLPVEVPGAGAQAAPATPRPDPVAPGPATPPADEPAPVRVEPAPPDAPPVGVTVEATVVIAPRPVLADSDYILGGEGRSSAEEPDELRGQVPEIRFPSIAQPVQTVRRGGGFVTGYRWDSLPSGAHGPDTVDEAAPDVPRPVVAEYTLPEPAAPAGDAFARVITAIRVAGLQPPPEAAGLYDDVPTVLRDDLELDGDDDPTPSVARVREHAAEAAPVVPELREESTDPRPPPARTLPEDHPDVRAAVADAERVTDAADLPGALAAWSAVLALCPSHGPALLARARVRVELADGTGALRDVAAAEALAPFDAAPRLVRAEVYFAQKDYGAAVVAYDSALVADPFREHPGHAMALCRRGLARFYLKDWNGACEDLDAARAMDPRIPHVGTYAQMARARARGGR
jgi:hypothetical protein